MNEQRRNEQGMNGQEDPRAPGARSLTQEARAKISVPDELREPYERIVLAGQKVLYSEETDQLVMSALEGDAPIEEKLAKGIRDLMVILWKQSNQSMPPQLIIPAAVELLTDAADYVNEAGIDEMNEQQLAEAMRRMVGMIMDAFGVTEDRIRQAEQQQGTSPVAGLAGDAPPGAGSGIISRAMRRSEEEQTR